MQTELIETGELKRALEAVLFVAAESLSIDALVKLTGAPHVEVAKMLQTLTEEYAERGIVVREIAGGYRFASSPAARNVVEAYLLPAKTHMSAPAMETLAIVAYLQPCTKAEIEAVRGVNVDSVVATLVDRQFIVEAGRRETVGRPLEYRTTPEFLESFDLRSLKELPPVDLEAASLELPLPMPNTTEGEKSESHTSSAVDDARRIWAQVDANAQAVAVARELVQPGEDFALTHGQQSALDTITTRLAAGEFEFLLKAPTGSGKTEVMLRVALSEALRTGGYVCLVAPTRDLVRQDCTYFRERLEGTGLGVGEIHGGISPGDRRKLVDALRDGSIRFVVGSAMLISTDSLWDVLDRSALTIIDDVNAFDEREHLRLLEDLDCPLLFASATPNEMRRFLERVGAYGNVVSMAGMPFDVLPTKVHKITGVWGEPPPEQLARADDLIRSHLERKSRIFVIGRTRGDVPRLAARLEERYGIEVQQLRGDMADSAEHSKRHRRSGVRVYGATTRVAEMRAFTANAPSILAATNLVGSGLDIPAADLIVITDADSFGESEVEQLIGRVGRREHPSDAVLVTETTFEKNPSRAMGGGRVKSFMPRGMRSNQLKFRR